MRSKITPNLSITLPTSGKSLFQPVFIIDSKYDDNILITFISKVKLACDIFIIIYR